MALVALTYTDTEVSLLCPKGRGYYRARFNLPTGLIQGGLVTDADKLSQLIKQAIAGHLAGNLTNQEIIIGLPEEHAFVKLIDIPKTVRFNELPNAFAYQWQSIFPISFDRVYYDALPMTAEASRATIQYLIVAYPKEIIDSLVALVQKLGSRLNKIIPLSFGLSALVSPANGLSALVVDSEDGKKLMVSVAQRGLTRFSTLVRTSIGTPNAAKQLEAVKRFYDQSIEDEKSKIAQITIIRSRFSDVLAKQLAIFNLPIEIIRLDQLVRLKEKNPTELAGSAPPPQITKGNAVLKIKGGSSFIYDLDHYTSLYGLVRSSATLSIVPPAVMTLRRYQKQNHIAQVHFVALLLGIATATTVLFLRHNVLASSNSVQQTFPPATVASVQKQESDLTQKVSTLNQQISQVKTLLGQTSNLSSTVKQIYSAAQANPGISLSTVVVDSSKKTVIITGSRTDRTTLTKFVTSLKANSQIVDPNPTIPSLQPEGTAQFEIDATIGATP